MYFSSLCLLCMLHCYVMSSVLAFTSLTVRGAHIFMIDHIILTACCSYLQILKIGFNHGEVLVWVSLLCITY
jgi:hypothetical protein